MNYNNNYSNYTNFYNNQLNNSKINNNMYNYMNNMSNNDILDPYQGFVRGNMFNNLYDMYLNYKPHDINISNERESILGQIQMYNFAIIDLNLLLDVYPDNKNALSLLKNYNKLKKELYSQYITKYGPLTTYDVNSNNFNYIKSPWPWESDK